MYSSATTRVIDLSQALVLFPDFEHASRWRVVARPCAPSWKIIHAYKTGSIDQHEYVEEYLAFLNEIAYPNKLINSIPNDAVLLCYEAPNQFCHRRILAKWIEEKSGIPVPEWKTKKQERKEEQEKINNNILMF